MKRHNTDMLKLKRLGVQKLSRTHEFLKTPDLLIYEPFLSSFKSDWEWSHFQHLGHYTVNPKRIIEHIEPDDSDAWARSFDLTAHATATISPIDQIINIKYLREWFRVLRCNSRNADQFAVRLKTDLFPVYIDSRLLTLIQLADFRTYMIAVIENPLDKVRIFNRENFNVDKASPLYASLSTLPILTSIDFYEYPKHFNTYINAEGVKFIGHVPSLDEQIKNL